MLRATLNEPVPLQVQAADGNTSLFARVQIFDADGAQVNTISLPHIQDGLYGAKATFSSSGYFVAQYQLFEDSGFTTPASYDLEVEVIEANEDKTNILRILGLTHDNSVMEPITYNAEGCLTEAEVRSYDSKANAELDDGSTGLLFSWSIKATYTGGQLDRYEVTRN